jgi:hypothetical protein
MLSEKALEAIKDYRPPKKLHPIASKTYDLYAAAGNRLTPEALEALRADLRATYGDLKATTDALCGLASFVIYANEHLDDPAAAEQISELMRDARQEFEPVSTGLQSMLQDWARKVSGVFDRFSDRDQTAKARAPVYDELPPNGTVPLKQLKPVAKPPPIRVRAK